MFADAWAELLRPEIEQRTRVWEATGTVSGILLGFIAANVPGAIGGAVLGNRLGAIRDAKGKAVSEAFLALPLSQRTDVLRALAAKVLQSM